MAAQKEAKRYGLRLTLPGAPATPHTVQGVNGYFWPDRATPVGGPGELSLESARKIDAAEGAPLELVEITDKAAEQYVADLAAFRAANGRHLAEAARQGGAEGQVARDEIAATQPTPAAVAAGETTADADRGGQ